MTNNKRVYYGFPVIASIKESIFSLRFPEGYDPSGDGKGIKEVADKLKKQLGGKVLKITKNSIKIEFKPKNIASIILSWHLDPDNH